MTSLKNCLHADMRMLDLIFPTGWYGVCQIELSHIGKTAENRTWCARTV